MQVNAVKLESGRWMNQAGPLTQNVGESIENLISVQQKLGHLCSSPDYRIDPFRLSLGFDLNI